MTEAATGDGPEATRLIDAAKAVNEAAFSAFKSWLYRIPTNAMLAEEAVISMPPMANWFAERNSSFSSANAPSPVASTTSKVTGASVACPRSPAAS